MNFTGEQMAAPAELRKCLTQLRDDYVVNNMGARALVESALSALKHLEGAFVRMVLQAGPTIEVQPPTTTASSGAKVVLTTKGEHAFTQVDEKPAVKKEAAKVQLKKNFVPQTLKKLNARRKKK